MTVSTPGSTPRQFLSVLGAVGVLTFSACDSAAPTQPPKQAVSKVADPEFSRRSVDRAAKGMRSEKPGVGRLARKSAGAPTPIAATGPVSGTLTNADETLDDGSAVDYFVYAGTRGERLTITLRSDAFDAYLLAGSMRNGLFDAGDEDDDSGGGTHAKLDLNVATTGPIVIAANAVESGDYGSYTLEVSRAANRNTGVSELVVNVPATGRLESGDLQMSRDKTFYDYWVFQGRGGQRVTITMRSTTVDAYLILKRGSASGDVIAEDDDGGGSLDARVTVTLPEDSAYTVIANSVEPGAGDYTLTLEAGSPNTGRGTASAPADYASRYPGTGNPNDRYALVVGIDDYPGTDSDLKGPVADAGLMRTLLINRFGFRPENIVMLTNAEATRDHIVNAFARHLGQAGPEGAAIFYYSGHGTQMPDNMALTAPIDQELDGRDEALYVWGTDDRSSIILDDEIGYLIDQLKTERVLLIHDSCNSGTSARGAIPGGQSKEVLMSRVGQALYLPGAFFVGTKGVSASTSGPGDVFESRRVHALLAGSRDDEFSMTASGWPDKGGLASVFTYYLVSALEKADDRVTLAQIMGQVQTQTVAYTNKTYKQTQTPQFSGTLLSRTVAAIFR